MAIPEETPICLAVVAMAEAVPSISLGTELMIELLLGGENVPIPQPWRNVPIPMAINVDPTLSRLRQNRARQFTNIPAADKYVDPILSDNLPLIGETNITGAANSPI